MKDCEEFVQLELAERPTLDVKAFDAKVFVVTFGALDCQGVPVRRVLSEIDA